MKMSRLWLLCSVAIISSCTVGPDYKRPQLFPDSDIAESLQLSGKENTINQEWYKEFNDVFLNTLIAQGLEYSPNIQVAIEKLRQARQNLRINAVQNLPIIDADGSYNYSNNSINYGIPVSTDYYQVGLDASWELDIWGGGRRLTESSLAMLKSASANLDNVRLSLTAEIAGNYFKLRQAQEQLRIAEKNLNLQSDIYKLVKDKYDVGLSDDITLNQSLYLLQTTQAGIPELKSEIENYQNSLAILVGRLPGQLQSLLSDPKSNPVAHKFEYDLSSLYDLPLDVIRNRPDVRIAEAELISQNAKIGQAISKLFPNISISGFLGWQAKNLSSLISSDTDVYNYSPAISLPLFDWGALTNNVELQKSLTKEQLYLYKNSLLAATSEIRTSISNINQEYERNSATKQALEAQEQVSELTLLKYKQGLVEFSEVLTAEQNLLSAQKDNIISNSNIYQDLISFYKMIGGGYGTTKKTYSAEKC